MKIGALAAQSGVSSETIRYYEQQGLLSPPLRLGNGYRDYGPDHLAQLLFIKHCRSLSIPMADIGRLLAFMQAPEAGCGQINALVAQKLDQVRQHIDSLRVLEQQLARLADRCHEPDRGRDCGILQELVTAAQGETCVCHPQDGGH